MDPAAACTVIKRSGRVAGALTLLLLLSACFDYEERVIFSGDWSGRVQYRYTVPVDARSRRSLIRFLPVDRPAVEERFGRGVENYEVRMLERPADLRGLRMAAEVQFEIAFRQPAELERILLGDVHVRRRVGRLAMERTFPVRRPAKAEPDRLEKRIRERTARALENHYMHFYVEYPGAYTLHTNRGVVLRRGLHLLTLPLSDTLDRVENHSWNMELREPERPKEETGTFSRLPSRDR